jgi:hypothetical protein
MMNQNINQNMDSDMSMNTANLYDDDYMKQIKPNKKDSNPKNDFHKAYETCDTLDETRALSESELMENYYKK